MTRVRADMNDVNLHYFLRPDHHDAARIWAATSAMVLPDHEFEDRRGWLFNHIEDLHDRGASTVVAIDALNGRLRGFVTIDPDSKQLHQIVVAPEALGSGLARMLLAEARDVAPARMAVEVLRDNARALRFFEREGFRRIGEGRDELTGEVSVKLEWRA